MNWCCKSVQSVAKTNRKRKCLHIQWTSREVYEVLSGVAELLFSSTFYIFILFVQGVDEHKPIYLHAIIETAFKTRLGALRIRRKEQKTGTKSRLIFILHKKRKSFVVESKLTHNVWWICEIYYGISHVTDLWGLWMFMRSHYIFQSINVKDNHNMYLGDLCIPRRLRELFDFFLSTPL